MKITKPLRISPAGALSVFFRCSYQYKLIVLEEVTADEGSDNLFAPLGSALHKAMQLNGLFDLSEEQLRKAWRVLFLSFVSESRNLGKDVNYDYFLSRGYDLLKNAFEIKKRWEDKTEIVDIEKYCRFSYKNPFIENVYLSGQIDLILKDSNNVYTATDWKSGKRICEDIDEDLQLSFYIYYIHQLFGIDYENIYGALVYPATKKILFTQRTEEDLKRIMFDKIDLMLERISKDDFKKEPKIEDNLDNCIFCPYITSCDKL